MRFISIQRLLSLTLLSVLLGAVINTPAVGQETIRRLWTSRDGTARIQATLVDLNQEMGTVRLRDVHGQVRDLPLQSLSLRDQRFLQRRSAAPEASKASAPTDIGRVSDEPTKSGPTPGEPQRLYGIDWQPTLEEGLQVASSLSEESESRPVMWFRVLGDLDGLM